MRSSKSRSRGNKNRNNRPTGGNIINRVFDSSGPDGKVRGTPQQIIDKVLRYHEQMSHEVLHISADGAGLTPAQHRATLELFQSDIAPVLRREIPSRPFPPTC